MKLGSFMLLLFLFISCNSQESKYGVSFNIQRENLGLPLLPTEWRVAGTGKDQFGLNFIKWAKPYDGKTTYPYYLSKTVVYNSDTIIYEENNFIGKDTFVTIDGSFHDHLSVIFNFSDFYSGGYKQEKGLECFLRNKDSKYESRKISASEADSVLKSWQLIPLVQ